MVVAIVLLVVGINFMGDNGWFNEQRVFYATYNQVDGLTLGNKVELNGYKIGTVKSIVMDADGKLVVEFAIQDAGIKIPVGTIAKIAGLGLMSGKTIKFEFPELKEDTDSTRLQALEASITSFEVDSLGDTIITQSYAVEHTSYRMEYHVNGDTLKSDVAKRLADEVDDLIRPLQQKAVDLIGSIDTIMIFVKAVLDKEARETLSKGFGSVERSLARLEHASINVDSMVYENRIEIKGIISDARYLSSTLRGNANELSSSIRSLKSITDSIASADITQTINNASKTFEELSVLLDDVNKGKGTLGKLLKDSVLYENLEKASLDLDLLFKDMKGHPNRYVQVSVFGKKDRAQRKSDKERLKAIKKNGGVAP